MVKSRSKPKNGRFVPDKDDKVFIRLRQLRKQIADRENKAPYMIFGDRALAEMSELMPKNEHEFLNISGVGDVKLERYGDEFLAVINEF